MNINLLQERKRELKLSYDELSEKSGVPKSTLTNIFMGRTQCPRIDTMQAIENALGLSKPLEWTDEDNTNGVTDKIRIEVDVNQYEWLELRNEIIETKGEEYFNAVCDMIKAAIKHK